MSCEGNVKIWLNIPAAGPANIKSLWLAMAVPRTPLPVLPAFPVKSAGFRYIDKVTGNELSRPSG
jgi:hypothetical protein